MHLHTYPVSACSRASVEECLEFYKNMGYDGVFITNHFIDGNINIDSKKPYEEKIEFYFSDYEKGLEVGKQLGIKVFCGVELSYLGTDFLIYGLDKEWFLNHPEIVGMSKSDELNLMMQSGALVVHAHPYREAAYINHIRLFPRNVNGVEVINANRTKEENDIAKIYANHYGLFQIAGSDNHLGANQKNFAGVCCTDPVCSVEDFIDKVKNHQTEIFTNTIE